MFSEVYNVSAKTDGRVNITDRRLVSVSVAHSGSIAEATPLSERVGN